jgi:hypothetical protein
METFKAMKAGQAAMKQVRANVDVDNVDDMMDEIREEVRIIFFLSELWWCASRVMSKAILNGKKKRFVIYFSSSPVAPLPVISRHPILSNPSPSNPIPDGNSQRD